MRRLFRSFFTLAALAVGLPGCGKSEDARTPTPSPSSPDKAEGEATATSARVTLHVPGMT
jgi:predicted small lipoprotein YifL